MPAVPAPAIPDGDVPDWALPPAPVESAWDWMVQASDKTAAAVQMLRTAFMRSSPLVSLGILQGIRPKAQSPDRDWTKTSLEGLEAHQARRNRLELSAVADLLAGEHVGHGAQSQREGFPGGDGFQHRP